jgi:hypothetical protein
MSGRETCVRDQPVVKHVSTDCDAEHAQQEEIRTVAKQNVVSLNMPVDTVIEFLNALHNANTNGAVATKLANALAAKKLQHRNADASIDATTPFQDQAGLADDEKTNLETFKTSFSSALDTVCCHRKDGVVCGPGQPPCPGDSPS